MDKHGPIVLISAAMSSQVNYRKVGAVNEVAICRGMR